MNFENNWIFSNAKLVLHNHFPSVYFNNHGGRKVGSEMTCSKIVLKPNYWRKNKSVPLNIYIYVDGKIRIVPIEQPDRLRRLRCCTCWNRAGTMRNQKCPSQFPKSCARSNKVCWCYWFRIRRRTRRDWKYVHQVCSQDWCRRRFHYDRTTKSSFWSSSPSTAPAGR